MSIQEEASLILRLYELRREETMRKARDWCFLEFNPESMADINSVMFGAHSGYLRMVMTYWEMAAALVNHGAIGMELFRDTNGEHISVFAKLEPFLEECRAAFSPRFLSNLEKLVDATPGAREQAKAMRDRMKATRAEIIANRSKVASQN